MTLNVSEHALKRMKQRGITADAVKSTVIYGWQREYEGMLIYNLTHNIAEKIYKKENIDIMRYENMKVIVNTENCIITAYRRHEKIMR